MITPRATDSHWSGHSQRLVRSKTQSRRVGGDPLVRAGHRRDHDGREPPLPPAAVQGDRGTRGRGQRRRLRSPRRVEWGSNDGDTLADHRTDGAGDGSSDEAEGARAAGDGERSRLQ